MFIKFHIVIIYIGDLKAFVLNSKKRRYIDDMKHLSLEKLKRKDLTGVMS